MNWVKIANSFPTNPKIIRAGPEAAHLFVCAVCYSNEHLLDGVIPRDLLAGVAPALNRSERHAERLCDVGLWEPLDTGWRIHDYLDFQRSADAIREFRAQDSERKRRGRSEWSPNGIQPESHRRKQLREESREESPPVVPPRGGRQRDRARWEKDVDAFAEEHFPQIERSVRVRAVRQAFRYGHAQTPQEVTAFIREHFAELADQLERPAT